MYNSVLILTFLILKQVLRIKSIPTAMYMLHWRLVIMSLTGAILQIHLLKAVQVYRYIIRDSVEEKIEVLKELKSRRFDALFGEPGSTAVETAADMSATGSSRLSQKDFEFLLS